MISPPPRGVLLTHINGVTATRLWFAWAALGLLGGAELLTTIVGPQLGFAAFLALLILFVAYRVVGRDEALSRLALGLALLPLVRIVSLGLPLARLPQLLWYPAIAVPLFLAAWQVIRQLGLPARDLGFVTGRLPLQLAIAAGGVSLGLVEYQIMRPPPLEVSGGQVGYVVAALSLIIATGLLEELIFRGILQQLAWQALGLGGIVVSSLLFGAMHIGYGSPIAVVFACVSGYLFAYVVRRGGSLLGVSLAHGLANCTMLLLIPLLSSQAAGPLLALVPWIAAACAAPALGAIFWLAWKGRELPE